jgi:hypothetical protein
LDNFPFINVVMGNESILLSFPAPQSTAQSVPFWCCPLSTVSSFPRRRRLSAPKEWRRTAIVAFWELPDASELSANQKLGERSKGIGLGELEGTRTLQNSHRELHPQDVLVPVVGELDLVAAQMRSRKLLGVSDIVDRGLQVCVREPAGWNMCPSKPNLQKLRQHLLVPLIQDFEERDERRALLRGPLPQIDAALELSDIERRSAADEHVHVDR